jgi:hypothetical protein
MDLTALSMLSSSLSNGTVIGTSRTSNPSYYLPMWQCAPVIPILYPPYNFDLLSTTMNTSVQTAILSKQVVISEAYMIPKSSNSVDIEEMKSFAEWVQPYIKPHEDPMEPVSDIYYPILNNLHDMQILSQTYYNDGTIKLCEHHVSDIIENHAEYQNHHYRDDHDHISSSSHENSTVVSIFSMSIYWRDLIKEIMPIESSRLLLAFSNPCNPTFTYEIDGTNLIYHGIGDYHPARLDPRLQLSTTLSCIEPSYTGIPMQTNYCPFTLHIHPSDDMEHMYITNNPIYYANRVYFCINIIVIFYLSHICGTETTSYIIICHTIKHNSG